LDVEGIHVASAVDYSRTTRRPVEKPASRMKNPGPRNVSECVEL
jgi:hypothetical protein